jgi:hypothetical protein
MTNGMLYGSLGPMGVPLTATLAGGDGTLVTLVGWLMALSIGGLAALVVLRRWRARRRPVIRSVAALRRVTA